MDANDPLGMLRHHQDARGVVVAAAAVPDQQMSYQGGGGGSSSSLLGGAVSYNGKAQVSGVFESTTSGPAPRFQPNLHGISIEWTPEEQAVLDEGLVEYASESNIVRYAKIAVRLKTKTVRDVALRCRWITRREISKRRKEEQRKGKERKERMSDPSAMPSHAVMHPGFAAYRHGGIANDNDAGISYTAIGGVMGQLLLQNAQAFERISSNLAANEMRENLVLLGHARGNILHILNNLSDPPKLMKKMPPLPVNMNEELANFILPASTLGIQQ